VIWPIFIPSKSRAETQRTGRLLAESGLAFEFVVEPQEAEHYASKGRVMRLEENDRGLVYSRNSILTHCREAGIKWFWMLDDDISGFYRSNGKKNSRATAKAALIEAQMILSGIPNLGQAALEYQQYAWSSKSPIKLNGYCDVAVCINTQRTMDLSFREAVTLKLDRDFTLQVLASGRMTARASQISFSAPQNGSNKGGLQSLYLKAGKEAASSRKMQELWGKEICEAFTKPDGREDCRINWKHFAPVKK
jgi:hypothetical protein